MQLWTYQSLHKNLRIFLKKNAQTQLWTYQTLQKPPHTFLELEFQHEVMYVHLEILTSRNNVNIIKLIISVTYCSYLINNQQTKEEKKEEITRVFPMIVQEAV